MSKEKVKVGNSTYQLMEWEKGGLRYLRAFYYDNKGKRQAITGRYRDESDKKEFIKKLKRKALELQSGVVDLLKFNDEKKRLLVEVARELPSIADLHSFLEWRRAQHSPITLKELCERFKDDKIDNVQVSYSYGEDIKKYSNRLLKGFEPEIKITDISYERLNSWHKKEFGSLSAKSRNNARRFLVTLWKWGQEKGMCAAGAIPPERISKVNEKKGKLPVLAFSPNEARTLIKEIKEEFLPWLILCGWNGLRAEEVAPKPHDTKRALMWEDIIFDKGIIVVPAETAKTGRKRVIPLNDVSRKYLSGISNQKGRIVTSNPSGGGYSETKRIGELIGGWKKNGLRNSYISYRACLIGIAKTAMESGNSEAVCKSNYLDATTEEMSKEWFNL